ncbi:MAG: hypothetical protein GY950_29350 [bacterium]|nr:hypothetical protein [bacterium]
MPNKMSPEDLDNGFKWAYKESFRLRSNLDRTLNSGRNFPITFLGNLAYKIYIKRLFRDKRFPDGLFPKITVPPPTGSYRIERSVS